MGKFCPNKHDKNVKAEFDELASVVGEDFAYLIWESTGGEGLGNRPLSEDSEQFQFVLGGSDTRQEAIYKMSNDIFNSISEKRSISQQFKKLNAAVQSWNNKVASISWKTIADQAKEQYKNDLLKEAMLYDLYDVDFHYDRETDNAVAYVTNRNKASIRKWQEIFKRKADKNGYVRAEDIIDDLISGTKGTSVHYDTIINIISDAIKNKNIRLVFTSAMPASIAAKYNYKENIVYINSNAIFRATGDNRVDNIAATVMHELIHAITVDALYKNSELMQEAEKLLECVRNSHVGYLYGFQDIYEFFAELSNHTFVDALKRVKYNTGTSVYARIKDMIVGVLDKFLNSVRRNKLKNTAYDAAMKLLVAAAFPEDFGFNLSDYVDVDRTEFASRSDSKKLADRFNVLYKSYQRMPNKSVARQRIQNEIFETFQKLKGAEDDEAYKIALTAAQKVLGTWDNNIGAPVRDGSVLDWLYSEKLKPTPFSGIDVDRLSKVWQNSIGFYDNLVTKYIPDQINLDADTKKLAESVKSTIDGYLKPLWVQAMATVGDREVDRIVESEVFVMSQEDRDNMKTVAKDWLHKNMMYGDLNAFTAYVYNYSYSSNPIIKMAFHLIQDAETKILEETHPINRRISKVFRRADKGRFKSSWQTIMMEFDEDGIPTGNFVRPINYGQYDKDITKFIEDLNARWEKDYGYFYKEDNGELINSKTGEYASDEEWENGNQPLFIKYTLEIEKYKCERANRRYTWEYYKERLSRPYDEVENPNGHGLSPRTIRAYNYIQSNINYYLNLCSDDDGFAHPEKLDSVDKQKLDYWYQQEHDLSNPYNEDGTPKTGEERQIALEISAWQTWIGKQLEKDINWGKFIDEHNRVEAEAISTNNITLLLDFFKYNSSLQIHPDFLNQTLGSLTHIDSSDPRSILAHYLRKSIQGLVKSPKGYTRDLSRMENKPSFWASCKELDQLIEDTRVTQSREYADMFSQNFKFEDILYRDANGFAIDAFGNQVQPQDESNHRDLVTFMQYMVNKYTALAMASSNRTIPGVFDDNGNLIVFNGTIQDVQNAVRELFTYSKEFFDEIDQEWKIKHVPLTVFQMMLPSSDTFQNARTGTVDKTILYVPKGRFVESCDKSGMYINKDYDQKQHIAEQPKVQFYDNSAKYNEMRSDQNVSDLYDVLVEEMIKAQQNYSTDKRFNYQLPQINASTVQIWSRIISNGTGNTFRALWRSATTVEENDEGMRTDDEQSMNPDGSYSTDVPLKYLRKLKHPEYITTDVTSAVIMFINMATNYKYKQQIDPILKTFRYNLDQDNREILQKQLNDDIAPSDDKNSIKMYDTMLNKHVYSNQWIKDQNKLEYGTGDKKKIATTVASATIMGGVGMAGLMLTPGIIAGYPLLSMAVGAIAGSVIGGLGSAGANGMFRGVGLFKFIRNMQRLETTQILSLNAFSMIVGFGDSLTRLFKESFMGKYMDIRDALTSFAYCIYRTPQCIANIGNPVSNNKLTSMMQINGISKGVSQTYGNMNYGRTRKILSNLLMGGFSMLDWMANALLMRAFYNNMRYYEGDVVPKGFYTAYELRRLFEQAGHTRKEATLAHTMCKITLWDVYDEYGYVKPGWKDKVTQRIKTNMRSKCIKRGALYNGMNPDNDIPAWKQDIIGGLVGALRAWLPQAVQHLYGGGNDNTVINITKEEVLDQRNKVKTVYTKDKLTPEQVEKAFSWDYETGMASDQIFRGLGRSIKLLLHNMYKWAHLKHGDRSLSDVEKYAIKDAIIWTAITAIMMVGYIPVHEETWNVNRPKSREEAGPKTMLPWDVATYMWNTYIPNEYYKYAASDIYFRVIESQITSVDPKSAHDIIKSITAIASGLQDHLGVLNTISDVTGISGHSLDEVIKQQSYKYYTRGERDFYKLIGPLDNLHTLIAPEHTIANERFYTNTYGWIYKMFGVDFTKPEELKSKSNNGKDKVSNSGPGGFGSSNGSKPKKRKKSSGGSGGPGGF